MVIPLMVAATLLILQVTLIWHGHHVGQATARAGLQAARDYQGSDSDGRAASLQYVQGVAPRLLHDVHVDLRRTPASVTVTVHAAILPVVPGLRFFITEQASGPVERFASDTLGPATPDAGPEPKAAGDRA